MFHVLESNYMAQLKDLPTNLAITIKKWWELIINSKLFVCTPIWTANLWDHSGDHLNSVFKTIHFILHLQNWKLFSWVVGVLLSYITGPVL